MRGLTNAASRMGAVITSISDDSDLLDRKDPFVPSRGTTAALGAPSSMNPGSLVELAGGSSKGTVKSMLATNDTSGYIEAMGVTKETDKVLDGGESTKGKSVSGP